MKVITAADLKHTPDTDIEERSGVPMDLAGKTERGIWKKGYTRNLRGKTLIEMVYK